VWPVGQTQPLVSTLNAPTGTITANAAIIPTGTGGAIDLFVTNTTDMVIDINGYFAPPGVGGLSLYTLSPCRVLDTRQIGSGQPFSGVLEVNVEMSACSVPINGQSYVFNATVVPPAALGYLTLWPEGATQPFVSTLNAIDGAITSNMAIVPEASGGISSFASNQTQLVLDISGYFAPTIDSEALTWAGGIYPFSEYQQTIGWSFTANTSINVSSLDWFDRDGADTTGHTVDIWTSTGTLVGTACVGPGCEGSSYSASTQYWQTPVSLSLSAGSYLIGGWVDTVQGASDRFATDFSTPPTTLPEITYLTGFEYHSASITFPPGPINAVSGIVGPNFEIDPTP
jgi:hypothetical protein